MIKRQKTNAYLKVLISVSKIHFLFFNNNDIHKSKYLPQLKILPYGN
jgi:hypothetical protein